MKNIQSWQTSLIGIFLLSLGGGYLFHNATPDYIVYQYFLLGVAFALFFLIVPNIMTIDEIFEAAL
jgi:ABC-type sulfate transport system permease component